MAKWIKNTPIPPLRWADAAPAAFFRELNAPLGRIVVTFANLEAQLTRSLTRLLDTSLAEGAALEWLMQNLSNRIELFYFLAMQATRPWLLKPRNFSKTAEGLETLRTSAEAIRGALIQANADRNNLLHSAWTGLSLTDSTYSKNRLKVSDGKITEIPMRGISLQLLRDEAKYIISVTMRLMDWTRRFESWHRPDLWPAPLPDKCLLHSPLASLLKRQKKEASSSLLRSSRA